MNQQIKTSLGVIIILIIIATVGIFFWHIEKSKPGIQPVETQAIKPMQPVADATADWQMYSNDKYGFEIKYPTDYKISNPTPDVADIRIPQKQEYMQIQVFNNQSAPAESYAPNGAKLVGEVTIGGKKAAKYYTESPINLGGVLQGYPFTDYTIVISDNKYYEISYYGKGSVADSFEQLLSTFKFTK